MPVAAIWTLVALAAALVAAVIVVLLQLRRTLRAAEVTLESTGRRVDETLAQLTVTLERVNRASAELERGVQRVSSLVEALGGIGDALQKVRASVGSVATIGASLGSLLIGGLRAAFAGRGDDEPAAAARDASIGSEEMSR